MPAEALASLSRVAAVSSPPCLRPPPTPYILFQIEAVHVIQGLDVGLLDFAKNVVDLGLKSAVPTTPTPTTPRNTQLSPVASVLSLTEGTRAARTLRGLAMHACRALAASAQPAVPTFW